MHFGIPLLALACFWVSSFDTSEGQVINRLDNEDRQESLHVEDRSRSHHKSARKNRIVEDIEKPIEKIQTLAEEGITKVMDGAEMAGKGVVTLANDVKSTASGWITWIFGFSGLVIIVIAGLWIYFRRSGDKPIIPDVVKAGATTVGESISSGAKTVTETTKSVATSAWNAAPDKETISSAASSVGSTIASGAKAVGSGVASGTSAVAEGTKSAAGVVWNAAPDRETIAAGAQSVGNTVSTGAKAVGSSIASGAHAVADGTKAAVNSVN